MTIRERVKKIQKDQLTTAERLMARVHKTESCWLWCGAKDQHGYGQMSINSPA